MEIALLKEMLGNTDDRRMVLPESLHRDKRPMRLLPPHPFHSERQNENEQQISK